MSNGNDAAKFLNLAREAEAVAAKARAQAASMARGKAEPTLKVRRPARQDKPPAPVSARERLRAESDSRLTRARELVASKAAANLREALLLAAREEAGESTEPGRTPRIMSRQMGRAIIKEVQS